MILFDGFYNNAAFSDYGVESRSVYITLRFFLSSHISGRAKMNSLFRGSKLALDLVAPIE